MAILLAMMVSGLVLVALGELLTRLPLCGSVGSVVQQRITYCLHNWRHHTIRSIIEVSLWVIIVLTSRSIHNSLLLAVHVGTLASLIMLLITDSTYRYITLKWPKIIMEKGECNGQQTEHRVQYKANKDQLAPTLIPFLAVGGYLAADKINAIYTQHALPAVCLLSLLGGVAIIMTSELLILWTPSRTAGIVLQRRITHAFYNWTHHTLRSALEVTIWVGVSYGTFSHYNSVVTGLKWGTIAVSIVALGDEILGSRIKYGGIPVTKFLEDHNGICLPFMAVGGVILSWVLQWIYAYERQVEAACILSAMAGVAFMLLAELLVVWQPTRRAGEILVSRIMDAKYNWEHHTFRSLSEVTVWEGVTIGMYTAYGNPALALCVGILAAWGLIMLNGSDKVVDNPEDLVSINVRVVPVLSSLWLAINCVLILRWILGHSHRTELKICIALFSILLAVSGIEKLSRMMCNSTEKSVDQNKPLFKLNSDRLSFVKTTKKLTKYTMEEVKKHCDESSMWITVKGYVYDITKFHHHPGGRLILKTMAGKDCTDPVLLMHPKEVLINKLPAFLIGELVEWDPSEVQKELWEVVDKLDEEGMFETSAFYYVKKFVVYFSLLAISIYLICWRDSLVERVIGSALLGLFWQQTAFLGHDFGHNAVTHTRKWDWYGSILITLMFGVSGQWWKRSHNVHHVVTNSIEADPDIQHLPLFAVTPEYFESVFSIYHNRRFTFDKISRWFVSKQHILFYPVMSVARFNLYLQSFILTCNLKEEVYQRWTELAALVIYQVWMWTVFHQLPNWKQWLLCVFISHAVCGLVHVQICLSHFAMHTYHGVDEQDFFRSQLACSMNVDCPKWLDWLHGGLQFQVEHHLIPRLPRHNLRYAMDKYIKPMCTKYGVRYHSYNFIESNRIVLESLKSTAIQSRTYPLS